MPDLASAWTAEMVVTYFEEAVRTLAALPNSGPSTGLTQLRLEVVQEAATGYGFHAATARPPVPPARKISEMDAVLRWLQLIPQEKFVLRRVVALRAVTHYATLKPMPWKHIGERVGANSVAVKTWHGQGIARIMRSLNARGAAAPA